MEKKGKFQSPTSALMTAAVLGLVGECKGSSLETVKKDIADAFNLVNRAFAAYEKDTAGGDVKFDEPNIQVVEEEGDRQPEEGQKQRSTKNF